MIYAIKNIKGEIIFKAEAESYQSCVELAVQNKVSLRYADLGSNADLYFTFWVDYIGLNLSHADLRHANLSYADLRYAKLYSANLNYAKIGLNHQEIKNDFYRVLASAKNEVCGLREAVLSGKIEETIYEGEYCFLVGNIAQLRCSEVKSNLIYREMKKMNPEPLGLIELFFTGISEKDIKKNNPISKIIVEWIDEFLEINKSGFGDGSGNI